MVYIAPSILNADPARLGEEAAKIGAADWLHLDVMDGHFVPNLTYGPLVARALARGQRLPVEAHLMVAEPGLMLPWFLDAGCRRVIVHAEAMPDLARAVKTIKEAGAAAGVALKPATPPGILQQVLPELDLVLIMTVNPGFGAQALLPETLPKLAAVRRLIDGHGLDCRLEVDGGINRETIAEVVRAGADTLVVGHAIFGANEPAVALEEIRALAAAADR